MSVKKFLIFFVIIFLSLSYGVYAACSDNDGANFYTGGTVTITPGPLYYYDFCDPADTPQTCSVSTSNPCGITERTCVSGSLSNWATNCPTYFSCHNDGISGHADYCELSWDCTDSDSNTVGSATTASLSESGYVQQWSLWSTNYYYDECTDSTHLREFYCMNDYVYASQPWACPSATPHCHSSAGGDICVECTQESHCSASENCVNNQCVSAGCTSPTGSNGQFACVSNTNDVKRCDSGTWTKIEDCEDYVTESYGFKAPCITSVARSTEILARNDCTECGGQGESCCNGNGYSSYCRSGLTCSGGTCIVVDNCVDSDGGKDIYTRGYVQHPDQPQFVNPVYDSCSGAVPNAVMEGYCSSGSAYQTDFGTTCPSPYVCSNGVCVCTPSWGSCGGCTPTDCSGCWGTRSDGCGNTESCWINPNGCSSGVCCGSSCCPSGNCCGSSCCSSGQVCNSDTGACCSVTNLQYEKRCSGGSLYWYDNCGRQQALAETCSFGCDSGSTPDKCYECATQATCCPSGYPTSEGASCGTTTEYGCSSGKDSCGDSIVSRTATATCSNGICQQGSGGSWTPTGTVCDGTKYCIGGSSTCGDCNFTGQAEHLCEKDFSCQNNATGHQCASANIPSGEFCFGRDCDSPGFCDGLGVCSADCGGEDEPCCGVSDICDPQCEAASGLICSNGRCVSCAIEDLFWERNGDVIEGDGYAVEGDELLAVVLGNSGCGTGASLDEEGFIIYDSEEDVKTATNSEREFDNLHRAEMIFEPILGEKEKEIYYFIAELSLPERSPNVTIVKDCNFYEENGTTFGVTSCRDYAKILSGGRDNEASCWADCAEVIARRLEQGPAGETGQCMWGNNTCFFAYQPAGSPGNSDYYCKVGNDAVPSCGPNEAFRVISIHNVLVNKTTGAERDDPLCYGSCGSSSTCEVQIPCPKIVELPFFSVWNALGVVIILIIVYAIYIASRKKKRKK